VVDVLSVRQKMKKTAKIILRVIGVISVIAALFGLWYNSVTLSSAFTGAFKNNDSSGDMPYFHLAFYLMSTVCIICFIFLFIFGIQFIRGRSENMTRFVGLLIFEVAFFIAISVSWGLPEVGLSIAGASGVSTGGMMAQYIILFPLWAPPLALWASRTLETVEIKNQEA